MPETSQQNRAEIPKGVGAIVVFTQGSAQGRQFPILHARTVVGRKKGDILIQDLAISSEHAAIDYRRGVFHIVDLESKNGTFIEEKKIRDQQVQIDQDVRLGDSVFQIQLDPQQFLFLIEQQEHLQPTHRGLSDLIRAEFLYDDGEETFAKNVHPQKDTGAETPKRYIRVKVVLKNGKGIKLKYAKSKVLIGREDTDLVISDIEVSRKHAYLELQPNNDVVIQDLASANGSFVNGKRVTRKVLSPKDKIRVGETDIFFVGVERRE